MFQNECKPELEKKNIISKKGKKQTKSKKKTPPLSPLLTLGPHRGPQGACLCPPPRLGALRALRPSA